MRTIEALTAAGTVPQLRSVHTLWGGAEHEQAKYTGVSGAHINGKVYTKMSKMSVLVSIYIETVSYVLSEHKQLGKK